MKRKDDFTENQLLFIGFVCAFFMGTLFFVFTAGRWYQVGLDTPIISSLPCSAQ